MRAGEIFGIAGVAGNGQNALLLALSGEEPASDAAVRSRIDGAALGGLDAKARRLKGIVERARGAQRPCGGARFHAERQFGADRPRPAGARGLGDHPAGRGAEIYRRGDLEPLRSRRPGPEATAGSLSGGNLQKYIMGREILQQPGVLVVSQPTWGVDAGAAAAIHQALVDLAAAGSAIVVISQDLDELLSLCDTLAVINEGRLSAADGGERAPTSTRSGC